MKKKGRKIFGQKHLLKDLELISRDMKGDVNRNFFFRGPSGWGKTRLAFYLAGLIAPDSVWYEIPNNAGEVRPDLNYRVVILDEIHLVKEPEVLYPLMDSGKNTFIFCTNEFGEIKEPLENRCIRFDLEPYTTEEIMAIILQDFECLNLQVSNEVLEEIAENSNLNPREARILTDHLGIIFRQTKVPGNRMEVKAILKNYLQIEDGLGPLHRKYLDFLCKVRLASLDRIIFGTRIDKATITRLIEPVLIQKNLVAVTPRGRKCLL